MNQGLSSATAEPVTNGNAFLALLKQIKPEIERRIAVRFDEKITRARTYGPAIAAMLEAARDLSLRGGKRVRAGLIAAGWIAAGGGERTLEPAIDAGVSFELLQSYLLIQDDWMDGDPTRRGGPSVHAALAKELGGEHIGATAAILASDMTWGLAVETLLSITGLSAERRLEVMQVFMRIHEDVVLGQQMDVLGKAEDVEAMHDLKTGSYTMRGPLSIGAALAGGSPALHAALARFAAPLGVAFQLRDDLIGTFGDHAETGKPVGNDIVAGKRTSLVAEAERLANEEERRALSRAHGRADADAAAIAAATRALVTSGARRAVEERQQALCEAAAKELASMPVSAAARSILVGVVDALRVRPAAPEARS
ncbi:polyprenyl synthetase family protein [Polyangium jinanense]|uniref:Polyprenyl synthetase family protein n=1 Tax=Polyangium jinanense TaxID=2829994 RepID=A0A9X3XAL6_9BACT|nr:polyprenyl synthetase family protein [Polyangium jinanense]MDC3957151.1 polyprenyl synthetase family protein [Polyangium jinanense]MDC3986819.1 polyprenyl synthetase family protein [Polyangium jinanense]